MLKASIDIGTNSVRLLIAEISSDKKEVKPIIKKVDVVRIGAGVDKSKNLASDAIKRCINQLIEYKKILNSYNIADVDIIATSAVRDAQNRDVFLEQFKEELGWEFKTVSGNEEAFLTFLGVKSAFPISNLLVFDIGGGSTEFITETNNELQVFSINIGSVRITERFVKDYPISNNCYLDMYNEIEHSLNNVFKKLNVQGKTLIGVAGTVTSLAAMDMELVPYNPSKVHKYILTYDKIKNLHEKLKISTLEQIREMKGIHLKRSDVILAGSLICFIIMKNLDFDKVIVSESELLEGIVLKNLT